MAPVVVRGIPLELHPAPDYVSDIIRATGDFYEAAILQELVSRLTGGVLVDAGAMIGNHSAFLEAFVPGAIIHAFEPLPANLALLRENVGPAVTVHPVALSDRPGPLMMAVEPGNYGHTSVSPSGDVRVVAATLDSFGLRDVRLIKIDVEGHEPQVLGGARSTIAAWRPLIVIEDWRREYGDLLPGYRLAAEWERAHQTFLYEPA